MLNKLNIFNTKLNNLKDYHSLQEEEFAKEFILNKIFKHEKFKLVKETDGYHLVNLTSNLNNVGLTLIRFCFDQVYTVEIYTRGIIISYCPSSYIKCCFSSTPDEEIEGLSKLIQKYKIQIHEVNSKQKI